MGRAGNLSVLGLYEWDNTLFDLMVIPEALDKEVLVNNILSSLAELEVLYANPIVMKNLIGVWSHKNIDVWNRLYATTQYDYDPIANYDRTETGSESGTGSKAHRGNQNETSDSTVADSGTDSTVRTGKAGGWIAGFDSVASGDDDGLVKKTRDESDTTADTTYGKTVTGNGRKTTNFSDSEEHSNNGEHTLHAHGNIGVTTTQKLIREQREIEKFNLYDIIIDEFKMRFCILVY